LNHNGRPSLKVKTAEAKAGMVLASDAVNPFGALLLRAGHILSEKNIRMLKSWGVGSIMVVKEEDEEGQESAEAAPFNDRSVEEEVKRRFSRCLDDPIMAEVMRVALELKLKSLNNRE
jgi:hypothetical protein